MIMMTHPKLVKVILTIVIFKVRLHLHLVDPPLLEESNHLNGAREVES